MVRRSAMPRRAGWKRNLDLVMVGAAALAAFAVAEGGKVIRPSDDLRSGRGRRATPPSREAARLGYETEDMAGRTMTLLALGLALFSAVAIGAAIGLLSLFHAPAPAAALTAEQRAAIEPPAPHLQAHPHADLRDLRAREEELLQGYAWLDARHQSARVPIGRAMALTVGRSLDPAP